MTKVQKYNAQNCKVRINLHPASRSDCDMSPDQTCDLHPTLNTISKFKIIISAHNYVKTYDSNFFVFD